ncbi:MAG: Lrp/AsnC family transcriptional regulator [Planctomycetes bacterium]|nr:Lrp/AsnC family transcriptional regulator [Planctomycetota bacterium]
MLNQLTEQEKRVLAVLQEGFPKDSLTPYADMAGRIGIETQELLTLLTQWQSQRKIRRIGAIINHFHVGMGSGAMVVWQVEPSRIEEVGLCLAGFEEVSHAYQRPTSPQWPYNLYTMVHGADPASTEQTVKRMSEACGVSDHQRLLTEKELKKVPPTYIIPDNPMRQG